MMQASQEQNSKSSQEVQIAKKAPMDEDTVIRKKESGSSAVKESRNQKKAAVIEKQQTYLDKQIAKERELTPIKNKAQAQIKPDTADAADRVQTERVAQKTTTGQEDDQVDATSSSKSVIQIPSTASERNATRLSKNTEETNIKIADPSINNLEQKIGQKEA